MKGCSRALVVPVVREPKLLVGEVSLDYGEKSLVYIQGARTANRHR